MSFRGFGRATLRPVITKRQSRRIWRWTTWLGLGAGLVFSVAFTHDLATQPKWPDPRDFAAWMVIGLAFGSFGVGLYSLWRGPTR